MKTKLYLFLVTILTVSIIFLTFISNDDRTPVKIGVVMIGDGRHEKLTGLQKGMQELGYHKGDVKYVVKSAHDNEEVLDTKINELIKGKPALIVTLGGIETLKLKEKMEQQHIKIPVVFAGVAAPKEMGIIKDYRLPGGLFTGINNYHTNLSGKRLELFHDLVPSIQRFHILYDENIEVSKLSLENTKQASEKLSLKILPCNVSDPSFKSKLKGSLQKNDALLILPGFRMESLTKEMAQFSRDNKVPAMGIYEQEAGVLASYGASFFDQGYQAARFVSLIIQGNSPAEIPVELPDRFRFIVNQHVKNELGIELNKNLIHIPDFIISEDGEVNP
ncbi:ABC transporter substrate-binding protein [Neobacillus sp.]|uniref:ABC transporter substrate-binding protein n=1 Tax=Neobacillus sp. TaxID=2675273 RepID=UPI0028A1439B|nr:ABC transporter substrate-binding protein [Neobacillus sp.]